MDISSLQPQERIVEILHPGTKEQLGIKITLLSLVDERMKKLKRKIRDNRLSRERKGKSVTAEELEENENNLLFESMTGWEWSGDNKWRGEKPEFNRANVMDVLNTHEWFRNQIVEAVGDEEAFFSI